MPKTKDLEADSAPGKLLTPEQVNLNCELLACFPN
jgi:hypothetical protein